MTSKSPLRAARVFRGERPVFLALLALSMLPARAAVIYGGQQDIPIPADFAGVYLDLDAGLIGTGEATGWDLNLFFGGVAVANSPAFQPARIGTGEEDALLRLTAGMTIDATRLFSTGYGGSETHLGPQFTAGQEGYLGFKFTTNAAAGPYYGWMRVVFTGNTSGALIKDWAYENSGSGIIAGRVVGNAVALGERTVTLSPAGGETFTLGSALINPVGHTLSLQKTGAGTTILAATSTNTGGTTISEGILRVGSDSALGTGGGVAISSGATLQAGGTFTSSRTFTLGSGGGKIDTNGQTVTLSEVSGSALTKLGSGTLLLNGAQTYDALTATAGTTSIHGVLGTAPGLAAVSVNPGATVQFGSVSQTLGSLSIGAGASVSFTSGPQNFTKNLNSTQTLTGFLNYASVTTNAGVLNVNGGIGSGTSTVAVNNPGTKLKFGSVSQTLASLSIGAGTTVIFTSGVASGSLSGAGNEGKAPSGGGLAPDSAAVPEPGTLGLLVASALGLLGRRRSRT